MWALRQLVIAAVATLGVIAGPALAAHRGSTTISRRIKDAGIVMLGKTIDGNCNA